MAFEAKLIINDRGGKTYDLVECEYEFYQSVDESGKPSSRPQSGLIKFVMAAQDDSDLFFYNWMFSRANTHSGTIEMLISTDENKKSYLHLQFGNAYLINMYQYFNNNNSLLVRTKITLSAMTMNFGSPTGITEGFINDWKLE